MAGAGNVFLLNKQKTKKFWFNVLIREARLASFGSCHSTATPNTILAKNKGKNTYFQKIVSLSNDGQSSLPAKLKYLSSFAH